MENNNNLSSELETVFISFNSHQSKDYFVESIKCNP